MNVEHKETHSPMLRATGGDGRGECSPLPLCNRRGIERDSGFFECKSNRLIHPDPCLVASSTCAICIYANKPDRDGVPPVPPCKSRGLGDTIAKFARATGIAQAVETVSKITGRPCGCKERQEALNRAVPYQKPTHRGQE
jgi:hypothetical protein